ncbi:hypothetical protein SprV_0501886800 [Sparganum proliferum]
MSLTMLMDAYHEQRSEIDIHYGTVDRFKNICRLKVTSRVSKGNNHNLLFTNNRELDITDEDMQRSVDLYAPGCSILRLPIGTVNTVILHQLAPNVDYTEFLIKVSGTHLTAVDKSAHLGSDISISMTKSKAGSARPTKPSAGHRTLSETVLASYSAQN